MQELFTFEFHEQERILEVRLLGRWTVEDVHKYRAALSSWIEAHPASTHKVLIDLSEFPVQKADVADLNQATVADLRLGEVFVKTAMVVGGAVTTMQISRNLRESSLPANMYADRATAWAALVSP